MIMKQAGVTLIELVTTLAVISILVVLGVPQLQSTTANSRLTTAINTLTGDLSYARTEAIKRGETIKVTATNDDWADGWTIALDGDSTTLRISPALIAGAAINSNNINKVQFSADGRSTAAVTFSLCDDRTGAFGKTISLTTTGQTFLSIKQTCP